MWIIGRLGIVARTSLPACAAFFRHTAAWMSAVMSSSDAPPRMASRSEISVLPKRHTLSAPSARSRTREHVPQKCSDIDVMNPIFPLKPGTAYAFDVSFGESWSRLSAPNRCSMRSSSSVYGTNFESLHLLPPNGMYSIKRMSNARSFVIATKSPTSSSLTPRITTQLTLTDANPAASADSIAPATRSKPCRRAICSNLGFWRVSSEMFRCVSPALRSSAMWRWSRSPFVVIPSDSRPRSRSAPSSRTTVSASLRTSGSPPVSRIFFTPNETKRLASRTISGVVRIASVGESLTPSSGMQYVQRRLQRSVNEIRR
eukprot:Amastigsp_a510871_44.p2 type:complete len:315 gc:universal Amastigsp_a510871_44:1083-139(-)